ncbi:biliverdin-producing heme oxygenase [Pararhizobium mangrovi]|nr:biliverdin-producing heme oxygenase [Pararhizobium mangrovi]
MKATHARHDVRRRLRAQTRAEHDAVDAAFAVSPHWDDTAYRTFLRKHARIVLPAEAYLARHPDFADIPNASARLRAEGLAADLADLRSGVPQPMRLQLPEGRGGLLGVAYVMEGSRLGGRLIARQLAAASPHLPFRFLDHGDALADWASFLAWIDAGEWSDEEVDTAIDAARDIFSIYAHLGGAEEKAGAA